MTEREPTCTRRQVAQVVGFAVVFVVLANAAALWVLDHYSPNRGYALIERKWRMLLERDMAVDWLILGDSSANQGVMPDVLTAGLGGTALNLATLANATTMNDAWMLQTHVARFGAPRGAIVVHTYDMWRRPIEEAIIAKIPLAWGYWAQMDPAVPLGVGDRLNVFVHRYVPLFSETASLGALIRTPRAVLEEEEAPRADGFDPEAVPTPDAVDTDRLRHIEFLQANRFRLSEANRRGLAALRRLAAAHKIDIYLVAAPVDAQLATHPRFRQYVEALGRALERTTASHPRLHLVFRTPMTFDRQQMQSVDHLTLGAARVFTSRLAEEIKTRRRPR